MLYLSGPLLPIIHKTRDRWKSSKVNANEEKVEEFAMCAHKRLLHVNGCIRLSSTARVIALKSKTVWISNFYFPLSEKRINQKVYSDILGLFHPSIGPAVVYTHYTKYTYMQSSLFGDQFFKIFTRFSVQWEIYICIYFCFTYSTLRPFYLFIPWNVVEMKRFR